jgi:hypothetical protein
MTDAPESEFPAEKIQACAQWVKDAYGIKWLKPGLVRGVLRAAKEWDAREGGYTAEQRVEAMRYCCEGLARQIVPTYENWTDDFTKGFEYACQEIAEDIASLKALTQSTAKGEGE